MSGVKAHALLSVKVGSHMWPSNSPIGRLREHANGIRPSGPMELARVRLLALFVTPKHPMGQRVFVSFDVSPVGYLAHEFSVVV